MVSLVTPLADIALLRKRENEILIIHTEIKVKTLPINKIVLIQRYRHNDSLCYLGAGAASGSHSWLITLLEAF